MKSNPAQCKADRSANILYWTLQGGVFLIWAAITIWMVQA